MKERLGWCMAKRTPFAVTVQRVLLLPLLLLHGIVCTVIPCKQICFISLGQARSFAEQHLGPSWKQVQSRRLSFPCGIEVRKSYQILSQPNDNKRHDCKKIHLLGFLPFFIQCSTLFCLKI